MIYHPNAIASIVVMLLGLVVVILGGIRASISGH